MMHFAAGRPQPSCGCANLIRLRTISLSNRMRWGVFSLSKLSGNMSMKRDFLHSRHFESDDDKAREDCDAIVEWKETRPAPVHANGATRRDPIRRLPIFLADDTTNRSRGLPCDFGRSPVDEEAWKRASMKEFATFRPLCSASTSFPASW